MISSTYDASRGKLCSSGRSSASLGYSNVSKGSNRIQAFEGGGKITPDLLGRLAEVLAIRPDEIQREAFKDYKDWLAWASEPIRPYVVVRLWPPSTGGSNCPTTPSNQRPKCSPLTLPGSGG